MNIETIYKALLHKLNQYAESQDWSHLSELMDIMAELWEAIEESKGQ